MREIDLLGMELRDYSAKEALFLADNFLSSGALNTILYVSARMMIGAGLSEQQKEWIQSMDLILWNDGEILRKAGVTEKSRIQEADEKEFIQRFLEKLAKKEATVYLLAETQEELNKLRMDILHVEKDISIVGESIIPENFDAGSDESTAALVNEINTISPTVVISRMLFEKQEPFVVALRPYLNAEVWLALNQQLIINKSRHNCFTMLINKWYHLLFHSLLHDYKEK